MILLMIRIIINEVFKETIFIRMPFLKEFRDYLKLIENRC